MKKLLLLLLIAPVLVFGQGEQRYAEGTATDQDGNTFEWINYGDLDWAIDNAEVVTFRDGTPITEVTDDTEWANLTTAAWCYIDNDTTKSKLYNWFAVSGKHDSDETTTNKEFAPEGWRVASESDWNNLINYLIENGYNYDGTTTGNKIAKAAASNTGWDNSNETGQVGNNQTINNLSGLNIQPLGWRQFGNGQFFQTGVLGFIWTSSIYETTPSTFSLSVDILFYSTSLVIDSTPNTRGYPVRYVRDALTSSIKDFTDAITIYPNPTTSIVTLQGDKQYDIEVYTLQGKKVMALTGNTIDMSHLSSATYIVKALDKVENEEVSYKVVKN